MDNIIRKTGCVIIFFFAAIMIGFAQFRKPMQDITGDADSSYSLLAKKFGSNKEIPSVYEKQIVYALSYFPELVHTKITFRTRKSAKGIISTRPTFGGLFRSSSKRRYLVNINDSLTRRTLPVFANGRINGQVGILGHEFCHILYFNKRTGVGLIALGIAHISTRFLDRFENKTDSMDIERGLGYQLIDWKTYIDENFKALGMNTLPGFKKSATRERYMSVEHIRQVMAKSNLYSNDKL